MNTLLATWDGLQKRFAKRPPEYRTELMACHVGTTVKNGKEYLVFQTDTPQWAAMQIKYAGQPGGSEPRIVVPGQSVCERCGGAHPVEKCPIPAGATVEGEKRRTRAGGCCGRPSNG